MSGGLFMAKAALAHAEDALHLAPVPIVPMSDPIPQLEIINVEGGQVAVGCAFFFGPWGTPDQLHEGQLYQWRAVGGATDGRVWVNDGNGWGSLPVEVRLATVIA